MNKVLMCDPPSGWKHGFPKPLPEEYHTLGFKFKMFEWLVKEGYPQSQIDSWGDHFYCRYYELEVDDE